MGKNLITKICCFFLFIHVTAAVIAKGEKLDIFSAEYRDFDGSSYNTFEVVSPAVISNTALQLTPDFAGLSPFALTYTSGRILLKKPFKLWEGAAVASFNTSFLINVFRVRDSPPGEGLAFLIAPDLTVPPNSFGQFLGLTNSWTDGDDSNKLVAVEFDATRQFFDPDDNHVGINVNSIQSIHTEYLTPHNITISPLSPRFYNVWLDYSGVSKVIDVYIAEQEQEEIGGLTPPKPVSPVLSTGLNLSDHVNQHSYFGFSASTGNSSQFNSVLRWNLTVQHFPDKQKHENLIKIGLEVGLPILLLLIVCVTSALGYYFHKKKTAVQNPNLAGALKCLPGMPREFKFTDLKNATNNFDEKNKLGQGGFGVVYKGVLVKENNTEIAVKWFSRESIKGQYDFLAELTIINRLRHKHLVKLLGWCHKNGKLLLVYEYMPNSSLDAHLFIGPNREPLEWSLRYRVIHGVASALHYLHDDYEQKVVHRDLKASNIMLDSNFDARLGDFGLARALENGRTSYAEAEGVIGTIGYIGPECFLTGKATRQSDVFAFGAVLLEVVCGQRPGTRIAGFQFLVDWVWLLHRDGRLLEAVDQRLGDDYVAEEAERLLLLGLACSHPIASERPKAEVILQIISGTVMAPVVPPFKPAFVWHTTGLIDDDSSSLETTTSMTSHLGHLSTESKTGITVSLV